MRHIIVFLLFVPFSAIANDAQPCHDHLKLGLKDKQGQIDQELCRDGYAVGYSYYYKTPLWVPSHLYKVLYIPSEEKMIGWIIPNESFDIDDLKQYQKTIKKIENRAGLDFFNKIPNDKEKQLERVLVNDLL